MSPGDLKRRAVERLTPIQRMHLRNAAEVVTNRRGQRRPISRDYLFRTTEWFTPSFTIESEGARFVLSTADKEISRILFIYGWYDRPLLETVHRLMPALTGRPFDLHGKAFLDVGANIGSATVEALAHFGASRSVAFEPDPDNFRFLQQNLAANGLLDVVDAHRIALSDRSGTVRFEHSPDNWGDHRVRLDDARENRLGERARATTSVEATTLDDLVDRGIVDLSDVALAWIDVQAHEPNMLAGATALTGSDIPVVLEYWPYGLRDAGVLDWLDEVIASSYTHFVDTKGDLGDPKAALRPVSELSALHGPYAGPEQPTDLLLLPAGLLSA